MPMRIEWQRRETSPDGKWVRWAVIVTPDNGKGHGLDLYGDPDEGRYVVDTAVGYRRFADFNEAKAYAEIAALTYALKRYDNQAFDALGAALLYIAAEIEKQPTTRYDAIEREILAVFRAYINERIKDEH
jgi:hypothetical protein